MRSCSEAGYAGGEVALEETARDEGAPEEAPRQNKEAPLFLDLEPCRFHMPAGWDEQDWRQLVELFRAQPEAGRRDRDRHTAREVAAAAVLTRRWGASRAMFL